VPVPVRPFFGRTDERQRLQAWLAAETPSVAVLIGVAGIGKTALITRLLADEPRPTFMRRVYAHDDAHGLLSSFADFLARQGRRRLKSVITRPAYDYALASVLVYQLHDHICREILHQDPHS